MIIWLILIILGYLGTIIIAWQSIKERDCWTYAALILVLLGSSGAIKITYDTNNSSENLISLTSENAQLAKQLAVSQGELKELTQKTSGSLQKSSAQLLVKTDENSDLSRKIAALQGDLKEQAQQNSDKLMKSNEQLIAETKINADLSKKIVESQNQFQTLMHEEIERAKGNTDTLNKIAGTIDDLHAKGIITRQAAENLHEEIRNAVVPLTPVGGHGG